ncbi:MULTISPECIES: response regulator [Anoxybacillus]|uniref:response regulator n=1 Tax=Anoxybacillus TaxID=150247 RepID=UPI000385EE28|nr:MULTISPECIES: response regulator [Anoxybacillus]EPZ37271.1 response regulator receiver and unknown domain-containing protein [Anoxybacillus ayderensis]NNU96482.1 response regulator [Anoxybacillus sp. EFIL]
MTKPIRVLIVEDDKRIAEINRRFVERVPGYEVIGIATNEQEGKELITVLQPELILLDIYFPDMNGLNLLKWIREQFINMDVIMITAAREIDSLKQAMYGGVFDYIIKPIMLERFTETLVRYKEYHDKIQRMMNEKEIISQEEVDKLIRRDYALNDADEELPKGIHRLTLEKVLTVMKQYYEGVTAEEVGKIIGASRTTTRRYLEYLVSVSVVTADVSYGTVGRPERIYRLKRR